MLLDQTCVRPEYREKAVQEEKAAKELLFFGESLGMKTVVLEDGEYNNKMLVATAEQMERFCEFADKIVSNGTREERYSFYDRISSIIGNVLFEPIKGEDRTLNHLWFKI